MRRAASALLVAVVVFAVWPGQARAERPSDTSLVLAGMGMGVPSYFAWVIIHESSHAVAAKAFGAKITAFQILPGRHPTNKRFYFGYVQWRGRMTLFEKIVTGLAPKLPNLIYLATYAALLGVDAMPSNRYAQLGLTVFATGAILDFSKDLVAFWTPADVNIALRRAGLRSFWRQLPWRIIHLGIAAGASYAVFKGYQRVFADDQPSATPRAVVPLLNGRF